MQKTITLNELVENYTKETSDTAKETYLKNTVAVESYIPYATKFAHAENIVNASSYASTADENGNVKRRNIVKINTPMRTLFSIYDTLDLYTNIKFDKSQTVQQYDLLAQTGMIQPLLALIPTNELNEFRAVIQMVYDDLMVNNYESHAFISNQITRITDVMSIMFKAAEPALEKLGTKIDNMDEKELEKIERKITKFVNKVAK